MKVIILAGGQGARLWPMSREKYSSEALKAGELLYKKHNGVELAKLIKKEVENIELK